MANGIHTLAYGEQAIPTRVVPEAPVGGEDGATRVVTAAEARNPRIPLGKQKYGPASPDPNKCLLEARGARYATLQDGHLAANDPPAATALHSRAPARLGAPPPEVPFAYMWDDAI